MSGLDASLALDDCDVTIEREVRERSTRPLGGGHVISSQSTFAAEPRRDVAHVVRAFAALAATSRACARANTNPIFTIDRSSARSPVLKTRTALRAAALHAVTLGLVCFKQRRQAGLKGALHRVHVGDFAAQVCLLQLVLHGHLDRCESLEMRP